MEKLTIENNSFGTALYTMENEFSKVFTVVNDVAVDEIFDFTKFFRYNARKILNTWDYECGYDVIELEFLIHSRMIEGGFTNYLVETKLYFYDPKIGSRIMEVAEYYKQQEDQNALDTYKRISYKT